VTTNYHKRVLGEANAGGLFELRKSPLHYYDWATGPDRDKTEPMREGSLFHMALHEPEKFARTVVTIPKMPLRSAQNRSDFCDAVSNLVGQTIIDNGGDADALRESVHSQCEAFGLLVMTNESLATMRAMVRSLNMPCHRLARSIVSRGAKELELRWTDHETGVPCKALIDSWDIQYGILSDLKRTDSITKHEWKRKVLTMGYDYQIAWYRRALRSAGHDNIVPSFVCASPERPYPWAVYSLPEERLDYCDNQHSIYLQVLADCMASGEWPSLNNGEAHELEIRT
jgi:hypothetical protein